MAMTMMVLSATGYFKTYRGRVSTRPALVLQVESSFAP